MTNLDFIGKAEILANIMRHVSAPFTYRSLVLFLIFYFELVGALVVFVPILSYRKSRQMGASPFQALVLVVTSGISVFRPNERGTSKMPPFHPRY